MKITKNKEIELMLEQIKILTDNTFVYKEHLPFYLILLKNNSSTYIVSKSNNLKNLMNCFLNKCVRMFPGQAHIIMKIFGEFLKGI